MTEHLDSFLIEKFRALIDQVSKDLTAQIQELKLLLQGDVSKPNDTGLKGQIIRLESWKELMHPLDPDIKELIEHKEWIIKAAHSAKWRNGVGAKILMWLGALITATIGMFGKELGSWLFKLFGG